MMTGFYSQNGRRLNPNAQDEKGARSKVYLFNDTFFRTLHSGPVAGETESTNSHSGV
jgi:hypothetical protein